MELVTCLRLYQGLNSTCIDRHDDIDLCHLVRLRDILVDAPIFEERGGGVVAPSVFRATAMVFDWAGGGDAHSLVRTHGGGISPSVGAKLFRQVLRGLRALHRRGIVHRDIKVRVGGGGGGCGGGVGGGVGSVFSVFSGCLSVPSHFSECSASRHERKAIRPESGDKFC